MIPDASARPDTTDSSRAPILDPGLPDPTTALLGRLHMMLMGGGGSPVRSGSDKLAVAASAVLV